MVLDFVDENGNDVSTDEDRMFVDLNGYSYKDRTGRKILIQRCWYEDCLLYTSPSPRDVEESRMPSSA